MAIMKQNIIIYGASGGGQKVADTLKSFGIDIIGFCDSNETLYGSVVRGKRVYSVAEMQKLNPSIIIASDAHYDIIYNKLKKMGLENNCVLKEEIVFNQVKNMDIPIVENVAINHKQSVFIELLEGYSLGGIETWSVNVAQWLKARGCFVEILSKKSAPNAHRYDVINDTFHGDYIDFLECIKEIITYVSQHLPCLLVVNKQQQLFYAGYWLKKLFPNQVSILSVAHCDIEAYYIRQAYLKDYIDYIFSVSETIKRKLTQRGIEKNKILYKPSPPTLGKKGCDLLHSYSLDRKRPIKIAYAGRLETIQKRTDRFIPLIEQLEDKRVNYQLSIAGEGINQSTIQKYIEDHGLQEKVCLCGYIIHEEITHFWMDADIFINLSEFEGAPLSMIEAMYCGVVPIVFDVSGSRDFIENNLSGYVLPDGDCVGMAATIENLERERELLEQMGMYAQKSIQKKCNIEAYVDCILKAGIKK